MMKTCRRRMSRRRYRMIGADRRLPWINVMAVLASSLASQLPQILRMYLKIMFTIEPCGSWLASDGGICFNNNP